MHLITGVMSGHSEYHTIESFAAEIVANLEVIHEFENIDEYDDFDPSLTIQLSTQTIKENLAFCNEFFTSSFRSNKSIFLDQLDEYQRQESLSPWFIIGPNLRNDRDVVIRLTQERLLFKSFENLLPKYADDSSIFTD